MKKIIIHWTGGTYYPNATDFEHYHFVVDKDGKTYNGKFTPEDNLNCYDGRYAQHTGGGNTGAIGVAMCCMAGFKSRSVEGNYLMTRKQFEACCKLCADLAKKYCIAITPNNIMTHYEFGLKNPKSSSAGKIDIIYLPHEPSLFPYEIGDFIRNKIRWYYK